MTRCDDCDGLTALLLVRGVILVLLRTPSLEWCDWLVQSAVGGGWRAFDRKFNFCLETLFGTRAAASGHDLDARTLARWYCSDAALTPFPKFCPWLFV